VRPHFILFFGKEADNGPKTEKMWAMNIHKKKKKKKKNRKNKIKKKKIKNFFNKKRKKKLIIITIKLCFNNNFKNYIKKKVKVKIKVQEFVACIFFWDLVIVVGKVGKCMYGCMYHVDLRFPCFLLTNTKSFCYE
jgi:hypothetical protein